jgi:hypothetical protein
VLPLPPNPDHDDDDDDDDVITFLSFFLPTAVQQAHSDFPAEVHVGYCDGHALPVSKGICPWGENFM